MPLDGENGHILEQLNWIFEKMLNKNGNIK